MKLRLPALLLLSALAGAPAAAQLSVTADVNKLTVGLHEQVVLAVTVTGPQAALPDPQMPATPGFSIYSSGRSQNFSLVNGKLSGSATHTFVLVPRAVGKTVIPPISVSQGAAKAQTEPIEIEIVAAEQGGPAARPGQPARAQAQGRRPAQGAQAEIFLTAGTDKKKAYVNEQLNLIVTFHFGVPLIGDVSYDAPSLSGFLSEELPQPAPRQQVLQGRPYQVMEVPRALFAAQSGRLTIGRATVRCQVRRDALAADPTSGDFFDRFFSMGMTTPEPRTVVSEPLTLEIEPLPEAGKPKDFSGFVGSLALSAELDRYKTKVGEAVTLTVTARGAGNLKGLTEPAFPDLTAWRKYDTVSALDLGKAGGRIAGVKTFKTVLVPRVSGELVLPAMSVSYFDPQQRAYARAATRPLTIAAAPGEGGPAPVSGPAAPALTPAQPPKGLTVLGQDIRYLKTPQPRPALVRALEAVAGAGPLHAAPFLFFGALAGLSQWRRLRGKDPRLSR